MKIRVLLVAALAPLMSASTEDRFDQLKVKGET